MAKSKNGRLVLNRKPGESLTFTVGGVEFFVVIEKVETQRVKVCILAPEEVRVLRSELDPKRVNNPEAVKS